MGKLKRKLAALLLSAAAVLTVGAYSPSADVSADTPGVSVSSVSPSATLAAPKISAYYVPTDTAIKVTWQGVTGADGYLIYRRYNAGSSWVYAGAAGASARNFTDKGLKSCTKYQYIMRAYKLTNGKKVGGTFSNVINSTTRPSREVITGVSVVNSTTVRLSWEKRAGLGYQIYMKKSTDSGWTRRATIADPSKLSVNVTKLSPSTKYYFMVRAYTRDAGTCLQMGYFSSPRGATTPAATPYELHGKLSVKGANIVDKNGNVFKIKGMSTHGIMWEDYRNILSVASQKVLRDDWKCNTVRIAMYTEEWGGYTTGSANAATAKNRVIAGVNNATSLGMYAVIDWHVLSDQDPRKHQAEAVAFFTDMAKRYKGQYNVIYEICNEPNGSVNWNSGIKSYCQAVVSAIRKYDSHAIIICGTGTWSQDIDQVLGSRLSDSNCVYALHFYANTHTDWLRNRLQSCYNSGLPVLVSEFGTCDASGNGGFNASQTKTWLTLLDKLGIGYINWSASGKSETASAFLPGTDLKAIKAGESQLTESGKLVRAWYRAH